MFLFSCPLDINECIDAQFKCTHGEECLNTQGSFQCIGISRTISTTISPHLQRQNFPDSSQHCPAGFRYDAQHGRCFGIFWNIYFIVHSNCLLMCIIVWCSIWNFLNFSFPLSEYFWYCNFSVQVHCWKSVSIKCVKWSGWIKF